MYCDYLSKHFTDTKSCIQKCEICFEMGYLLMFKINNLANQTSHIVTEQKVSSPLLSTMSISP